MKDILTNPYFWLCVVLIALFFFIRYIKILPILKMLHYDFIRDHNTGKFATNNWLRLLFGYATLLLLFITHIKVDFTPLNFTPIAFTEGELGILLAGIGLLSWIQKPAIPTTNTTVKVESENTSIGPINQEQPKQKEYKISDLPEVEKPDAPLIKIPEPVENPDTDLSNVKIPGVN